MPAARCARIFEHFQDRLGRGRASQGEAARVHARRFHQQGDRGLPNPAAHHSNLQALGIPQDSHGALGQVLEPLRRHFSSKDIPISISRHRERRVRSRAPLSRGRQATDPRRAISLQKAPPSGAADLRLREACISQARFRPNERGPEITSLQGVFGRACNNQQSEVAVCYSRSQAARAVAWTLRSCFCSLSAAGFTRVRSIIGSEPDKLAIDLERAVRATAFQLQLGLKLHELGRLRPQTFDGFSSWRLAEDVPA